MIDWTKPVEDEDGRPVRVLCTDCKGIYPVVLAIRGLNDGEIVERRPLSGLGNPAIRNVIPKPVKREGWVNIRFGSLPDCTIWKSEVAAKDYARGYAEAITTVRIEWEEPAQ